MFKELDLSDAPVVTHQESSSFVVLHQWDAREEGAKSGGAAGRGVATGEAEAEGGVGGAA